VSATRAKTAKVTVGCEVAFNTLDDAVWFEVLAVNGFQIIVREAGTDYAPHYSDVSLVKQVRAMQAVIRELTWIEKAALDAFALEHGRNWKRILRDEYWPNARIPNLPQDSRYGSILHGLRNDPHWNLAGLEKYKAH